MTISTSVDVKASVGSSFPDDVITEAWEAAEAYVGVRVEWFEPDPEGGEGPPAPADLVQAVHLLTRRYLARRASPDGFLGTNGFGDGRVPVIDIDVDRLIAPWRKVVLA